MRTLRRRPPTSKNVSIVRQDMRERGFTLLDGRLFLDEQHRFRLTRGWNVLRIGSRRWQQLPKLVEYAQRLEHLLCQALAEEFVALVRVEYRHEAADSEETDVDRWHADGAYIRSVYTDFGPGTRYREGDTERTVPIGKTLIMTAIDRARAVGVPCTLHRRPGPGPERAVVICSFESRPPDIA